MGNNNQRRLDHPMLKALLVSVALASGMAHAGNTVQTYGCVSQDAHAERKLLALHRDGRFLEAGTLHTPTGDLDSDVIGTARFNERHEYVQVLADVYIGTQKERSTGMRFWSYEQSGPDMFTLTGIKYVDRMTGKESDTSRIKWTCKREPAADVPAEQSFHQLPKASFY
ncbi:hypothetical protein [Paraburkholderia caledonica]|uniref:Uncharacterized protein n=1 Tax=Paraburkholderia caledonica TaxID=134536 RepID=A0ABU1KT99_9BURK|nr:hypothetical protein [Paraburkholderia caledonica]MDR6374177.1 hypothetical protein [Paraburkholderia caledonica]